MNKIYLVSYYFAPLGRADGVNRGYLVKHLVEHGWDLEVITGNVYKSLILNFQTDPSLLELIPKSVKIYRFDSSKGWLKHDLKNLAKSKNNHRQAWLEQVNKKFQPSEKGIVMAVVPPVDNALAAYDLAEKYNCPLALYYPDTVLDVPPAIVERAALIIVVTPEIKSAMLSHYGKKNIIVIPHGYGEEVQLSPNKTYSDVLRMVYAGSLNFIIKPEIIGQAFKKLRRSRPDLASQLKIDFYGPSGYYAKWLLRPYLNEQLSFKGYLENSKLMETLPTYDMAVTMSVNEAFPSKVFTYLNAGLPLFAMTRHQGLVDFVKNNKIGLASDLQIDNIERALIWLLTNRDQLALWRANVLGLRNQFSLSKSVSLLDPLLKSLS